MGFSELSHPNNWSNLEELVWCWSGVYIIAIFFVYILLLRKQEISSEDTIFIGKEGEIFHEKCERKHPRIAHRPTWCVVSWCLCHLVLCARCELPLDWLCLLLLWCLEVCALPHLPKVQGCYRLWEEMKCFQWSWTWSKRHLWDATCLSARGCMSWDLGMKDSSTGDVGPLLCSKVCLRSWGEGPTLQVYLSTQSCSGLFPKTVLLCSSNVLLDILSHLFFRRPEERCKCLAKSWSRRRAL